MSKDEFAKGVSVMEDLYDEMWMLIEDIELNKDCVIQIDDRYVLSTPVKKLIAYLLAGFLKRGE